MSKRLTLLLSMIMTFAFASSVGAQTVPGLEPSDVEGLESGYGRMYIADVETMLATPEAFEGVIVGEIPLAGVAAVFTFEDEAAAETGMGDFADQLAQEFLSGDRTEGTPAADIQGTPVENLGDEAVMYIGETEIDATGTAPLALVIAREGENIIMTYIIGGADVETMTQELAQHLVDGELGTGEVVVVEDGTSTGGAFDLFTSAEEAGVVGGMLPLMDLDFFQETGTPEA